MLSYFQGRQVLSRYVNQCIVNILIMFYDMMVPYPYQYNFNFFLQSQDKPVQSGTASSVCALFLSNFTSTLFFVGWLPFQGKVMQQSLANRYNIWFRNCELVFGRYPESLVRSLICSLRPRMCSQLSFCGLSFR